LERKKEKMGVPNQEKLKKKVHGYHRQGGEGGIGTYGCTKRKTPILEGKREKKGRTMANSPKNSEECRRVGVIEKRHSFKKRNTKFR